MAEKQIIINGQLRKIPDNATANDIKAVSPGNRDPDYLKTRTVIVEGPNGKSKRIRDNETYQFRDGDRIRTVPNRKKARAMTFFGKKEAWRKAIIEDQVKDLSAKFFRDDDVVLDNDCNWVVFRGVLLPKIWQAVNPDRRFVSIMLIFHDLYPDLPTNGFYLPSFLKIPPNAQHIFCKYSILIRSAQLQKR